MLLYQLHEWNRAWLEPFSTWAEANAHMLSSPHSWMSTLPGANRAAAGYELLHRIGKDYEKPEFDIHEVEVDGRRCPVVEREVLRTPFCRLLRFKRFSDDAGELRNMQDDPAVLVVAPLSGHHATLLRDTVQTLLGAHKVYITDWVDARMVPMSDGAFHLDDYIYYVSGGLLSLAHQQLLDSPVEG